MKTLVLALLVWAAASAFPARHSTENLVFAGHELEPFYFRSGSQGTQGAMYELTQELCKIQKKHCKFKIAPFRSSLEMVLTGKADIGGPLAHTPQRAMIYYYSTPIFATRYCFFTSAKNFKENFNFDDLKGRTVGVFGPSSTELSLQRVKEVINQKLEISIEPDNHTALRKAENNTHDFSYVNCESGSYWIEKNRSTLKELPTLGEKTVYYIYFSKKNLTEANVQEFNKALETLRKNGFLKVLADKYKLTLAED